MKQLTVKAQDFRDADDGQSPLIIDRFGPGWFFGGAVGAVLGITAVPMPDDWDGNAIFIKPLGAVDAGSASVQVSAAVMDAFTGTDAYGDPATLTFTDESTTFKMFDGAEVTPTGAAGTDQFLALRFERTNAEASTVGIVVKEFVIEYGTA